MSCARPDHKKQEISKKCVCVCILSSVYVVVQGIGQTYNANTHMESMRLNTHRQSMRLKAHKESRTLNMHKKSVRLNMHSKPVRLNMYKKSGRLEAHKNSTRLNTHMESIRLTTHMESVRVNTHTKLMILEAQRADSKHAYREPARRSTCIGNRRVWEFVLCAVIRKKCNQHD